MSKNISEEREKQLQEISDFTETIKKEFVDMTLSLGWTVDSIVNDNINFLTCPYDSSHRITEQCLDRHLPACQWKAEGYDGQCVPFPESALSQDAPSSIQFDESLQDEVLQKAKEKDPMMVTENYECYTWQGLDISCLGQRLVPRTSDRLISEFTSDERKALYNYVIANTVKPDIGRDIADLNNMKSQDESNKEMSFQELLVQERNLKRRRAKHRGVHTNKKSHIEILREVINQQMDIYVDYISEQQCSIPSKETLQHTAKQGTDAMAKKTWRNTTEQHKDLRYMDYSMKETNGEYSSCSASYRRQGNPEEKFDFHSKKWPRDLPDHKEVSKRSKHKYKDRSSSRDRKSHKRSHKKDEHRSKEDRRKKKKHKSRDERSPSPRKSHSKHSRHRSRNYL